MREYRTVPPTVVVVVVVVVVIVAVVCAGDVFCMYIPGSICAYCTLVLISCV